MQLFCLIIAVVIEDIEVLFRRNRDVVFCTHLSEVAEILGCIEL